MARKKLERWEVAEHEVREWCAAEFGRGTVGTSDGAGARIVAYQRGEHGEHEVAAGEGERHHEAVIALAAAIRKRESERGRAELLREIGRLTALLRTPLEDASDVVWGAM